MGFGSVGGAEPQGMADLKPCWGVAAFFNEAADELEDLLLARCKFVHVRYYIQRWSHVQ